MIRPAPSHRRNPACFLLLAAALGALAACAPEPEPDTGAEAVAEAPAVQRYEMRGVVGGLPTEAQPAVSIRHEAVPDFVDFQGEVVGMESMNMPFPLADGVDLAGIEPGDKVAFTLEVEWDSDDPYRISRIEELPPDTALDLGG